MPARSRTPDQVEAALQAVEASDASQREKTEIAMGPHQKPKTRQGLEAAVQLHRLGLGPCTCHATPPADRPARQPDVVSNGDNGCAHAPRDSLWWAYGLSVAGAVAVIADSGNNRVLLWNTAS